MGFWDIFKRSSAKSEEAAAAATAAAAGSAVTAGAAAEAAEGAGENILEGILGDEWKMVGKLFGDTGDKLSGLMDKLDAGGLGDKLKSWIGQGDNEAVTPEQVKTALGAEEVDAVAQEMGVSSDEAAGKLAALLPTVIDKLTPDGLVPDPEGLAKKLTGLIKK